MRGNPFTVVIRSLAVLLLFTAITGAVYPLAVMAAAWAFFPRQAAGSLIEEGGRIEGSELIGRQVTDPRYFWGRPSATSPYPYNGLASGGSNIAQTNPDFENAVRERVKALRDSDKGNDKPIPADLVTASGSGLDPDISPAAADWQVPRIARLRGLPEKAVRDLVRQYTEQRWLGFAGESRVNVLRINRALDKLQT